MSLTSLMSFKGCRLTTTPDRSDLTDQSDSIPKPSVSSFHLPGFFSSLSDIGTKP